MNPPMYLFGLILDSLNTSADGILVAQVTSLQRSNGTSLWDGFEIIVQFVDQWSSGGDVQFGNFGFINSIQMLDQGTKGVSVSSNQDGFSILDLGNNVVVPVREDTVQSSGQRFGEFLGKFKSGVTWVIVGVVGTGAVDRGRGDVVATTPNQNLVLSKLVHCFLLVKSLQGTCIIRYS